MISLKEKYQKAKQNKNEKEILKEYQEIIQTKTENEEEIKIKEETIIEIGEIFAKLGFGENIKNLMDSLQDFFLQLPKARTAKIVRKLIELINQIPNSIDLQIHVCSHWIDWAKKEKRSYLRQRLESKLASLYLENTNFQMALTTITNLAKEVKKLDDKLLLIEVNLIETKIHIELKNIPKAKASLTSARTSANAVYCPPLLQSEMDKLSGILHIHEQDFKTAFSYFFESFEGYSTIVLDPKLKKKYSDNIVGQTKFKFIEKEAISTLKYMLLTKIMMEHVLASKFTGREIDCIVKISEAYSERSLHKFNEAIKEYDKDPIIKNLLNSLYETMLEQNLLRLIEPFSRVEISHIADLIKLDTKTVETKLSQMILDKKFEGILDQGAGCLIIYDETIPDETYKLSIEIMENLNVVIGSLYQKAKGLN
ncbi:26s proteasome non-atpase regulatory subunit 11 [Anaeramoeba ignava]|uniref:26s proteasome non-atpase regulatory subunit 11 n=1 Tax=Anaeramoeba ignava TaxID=1746090 RepID=A0A9Q0LSD1_ANAIG|nr:26s proteasome non-atpase regulatory subunit 11 [Anaeramoeba ignava]